MTTPTRNEFMPALLAADTFTSRSESWLGRAIRWWQATASGASDINHIGGVIAGGPPDMVMASEAVGHVRNVNFWRVYANVPIRVWRNKRWTEAERAAVARQWESAEGTGYAWLRMAPIMADSLVGWFKRVVLRRPGEFYWFTQKLKITNFKVCSNLWAWGIQKALGAEVTGRPWQCVTPDSAEDWFRSHPDDWELVWDSVDTGAARELAAQQRMAARLAPWRGGDAT